MPVSYIDCTIESISYKLFQGGNMSNLYTIIAVLIIIQCIQLVSPCITYSQLSIVIRLNMIHRNCSAYIIDCKNRANGPVRRLLHRSIGIGSSGLAQPRAYNCVICDILYLSQRNCGSFWSASIRYSDNFGAWRIVPVFP